MSSDLWYGEANGRNSAFLEMNVHRTLFLTVGDDIHDNYQTYVIEAGSKGMSDAQNLINALTSWIELQKE